MHVTNIHFDITEPIKMSHDVEFQKLALLCGANGTGKTLILKTCWALSMVACAIKAGQDPIQSAQFVFDNTFSDQNFNGTVAISAKAGGKVEVVLEKGKVLNAMNDIAVPAPITYMSSDMRTFDAISVYLKMRHFLGDKGPEEIMQGMLGAYKLYDVCYIESLIKRCPIQIPKDMAATLQTFEIDPIDEINVDLKKGDFYARIGDQLKYFCTYGKGHQAILNMFAGGLQ